MMKNILRLNLITALSLLVMLGCKEEKLEVEPVASYLETNYYKNEQQAFNALIAAYDPLQWTMHGGFWVSPVMYAEIRSDNANAGGDATNTDQPGWQEMDDFTNTPQTNETNWIWSRCYTGIYRTNLVLQNINIQSPSVAIIKAEAKFLRAYYHFDAFRHYGPSPIIDKVLLPDEYNQPRASMNEMFQFMVTDLEQAIPALPLTVPPSFKGRVTRTTAQALLGKIYLYWADLDNDNSEKFNKAAAALREVVNSGQYQLLDDMRDLYAFGSNNTAESVFEIQQSNISPSNWGWPSSWIDGNVFAQLCGVRSLCDDHPTYNAGWGFMLPTQGLNDHFLPDDTIRKDVAILSLDEIEGAIDTLSSNDCGNTYVDQADQNPSDYTGYWQEKYPIYKEYTNPNGGDAVLTIDANVFVIRYADVLLMLAEALHRGAGANGEAEMFIDMVRERAAGPGDNTGNFRTVSQLMSQEGWTLLEAIWYERRSEFALEGDRWFDLVRSGRANSNLFLNEPSKAANFGPEDIWIPVSQRESDVTGGVLTLYPGAGLMP